MNCASYCSIDHPLSDKWTLWAHLPHDTDWSLDSYKKIYTMETLEDAMGVTEYLPEKMIKNCMLFVMRSHVKPQWEDESNRNGGCFSYKVFNKNVEEVWKLLMYGLLGNTLTEKGEINNTFMGITISPKKNFCIIKIWMSTCLYQNPEVIRQIGSMSSEGCLFKKHEPEF